MQRGQDRHADDGRSGQVKDGIAPLEALDTWMSLPLTAHRLVRPPGPPRHSPYAARIAVERRISLDPPLRVNGGVAAHLTWIQHALRAIGREDYEAGERRPGRVALSPAAIPRVLVSRRRRGARFAKRPTPRDQSAAAKAMAWRWHGAPHAAP